MSVARAEVVGPPLVKGGSGDCRVPDLRAHKWQHGDMPEKLTIHAKMTHPPRRAAMLWPIFAMVVSSSKVDA